MTDDARLATTNEPAPPSTFRRQPRCTAGWPRRLVVIGATGLFVAGLVAVGDYLPPRFQDSVVVVGPLVVAMFVAYASIVAFGGLFDRLRRLRNARRMRRAGDAPWTADQAWNPSGHHPRVSRYLADRFGCFLILRAIAILYVAAFLCAASAVLFGMRGLVIAATASGGGVLTHWTWQTWRAVGRGRPHVTFARFPFFVGETVRLHFGVSDGGESFRRATYVLRRFAEEPGGPLGQFPRCRETMSICAVVPHEILPGPGTDVVLEFAIPPDAGGTALSAPFPSYWQLEIEGETTSGTFDERILIPIYERPVGGTTD